MKYKFEVVKNSIFVIMSLFFVPLIFITIIAVGRYEKQINEINKLNKQIQNQQTLIDYMQKGAD